MFVFLAMAGIYTRESSYKTDNNKRSCLRTSENFQLNLKFGMPNLNAAENRISLRASYINRSLLMNCALITRTISIETYIERGISVLYKIK